MNTPPSASQPSDSPEDRGDGSAEAPVQSQAHEHFGPLTLERMRKDDGRLLIVFRESREDQR